MNNLLKKSLSFLLVLTLIISLTGAASVQAATKIKLSASKKTLYVGKSFTLKLTGTTKKVTWSSSKKSVATVTSKGKVTAKKAGKATITAKVGSKKYTCVVTVKKKVAVKSVTVSFVSQDGTKKIETSTDKYYPMNKGYSSALGATVLPSNATSKKVTWTSSDPSVVEVSEDGKLKALELGTATITAKAGSKKGTVNITVRDPGVKSNSSLISKLAPSSEEGKGAEAEKTAGENAKSDEEMPAKYGEGDGSSGKAKENEYYVYQGQCLPLMIGNQGYGLSYKLSNSEVISAAWGDDWSADKDYRYDYINVYTGKTGDAVLTITDSNDEKVKLVINIHVLRNVVSNTEINVDCEDTVHLKGGEEIVVKVTTDKGASIRLDSDNFDILGITEGAAEGKSISFLIKGLGNGEAYLDIIDYENPEVKKRINFVVEDYIEVEGGNVITVPIAESRSVTIKAGSGSAIQCEASAAGIVYPKFGSWQDGNKLTISVMGIQEGTVNLSVFYKDHPEIRQVITIIVTK